ncbi:MAG: HNH endonuclease family protein [Candidatus Saccharibacteria bacterium]|nr:HNH endonuclease family protein [Candidatus Saccharibacteria bacterium]
MNQIFFNYRIRRIFGIVFSFLAIATWLIMNPASYETEVMPSEAITGTSTDPLGVNTDSPQPTQAQSASDNLLALTVLEKLEVKGRAPKTGYARAEFYKDWPSIDGCSLRQRIIKRDFGDSAVLDGCSVISGSFVEPYTGETKTFSERSQISTGIQIDHVVALSDAWQKGAQYASKDERYNLATDPLNLLAVDSSANQKKSDGDAATWLPSNKPFRCQYVARQVSVKYKYHLWITEAEKSAIKKVLESCPSEPAVGIQLDSS